MILVGARPRDKDKCGCRKCWRARRDEEINMTIAESLNHPFIVCDHCGNKRCPHAADHELECTGSNEPGQPGSDY